MHKSRKGLAAERIMLDYLTTLLESERDQSAARPGGPTMKRMSLTYRLGVEHALYQRLQQAGVQGHQPARRGARTGRGARGGRGGQGVGPHSRAT